MGEMRRASAREGDDRQKQDRFASTLVIAASIIAAVRLARDDISRPSPRMQSVIVDSVQLARSILNAISKPHRPRDAKLTGGEAGHFTEISFSSRLPYDRAPMGVPGRGSKSTKTNHKTTVHRNRRTAHLFRGGFLRHYAEDRPLSPICFNLFKSSLGCTGFARI